MGKEATLKHLRMAPRKVRKVADAIRGLPAGRAVDTLQFSKQAAARPLFKLLKSALINAGREEKVDIDKLVVQRITVDGGPTWKRWMPRARGSATPVKKRTSHVKIVLGEK